MLSASFRTRTQSCGSSRRSHGAERRLADAESIYANRRLRGAGRQDRRPQPLADYTQGSLTNEPLSYTRRLHHVDGRDRHRSPRGRVNLHFRPRARANRYPLAMESLTFNASHLGPNTPHGSRRGDGQVPYRGRSDLTILEALTPRARRPQRGTPGVPLADLCPFKQERDSTTPRAIGQAGASRAALAEFAVNRRMVKSSRCNGQCEAPISRFRFGPPFSTAIFGSASRTSR